MIALCSTSEMRAADQAAVARVGQSVLVERAGYAVGAVAKGMLGSLYGRSIAVVCGPGLNGADGQVAARWLSTRGARTCVIEAARAPSMLAGYDLVIDAAFGLGCSRDYFAPDVDENTRVLAVDLPSGVNSDSGAILGRPMVADVTIALGAFKPAHLIGPAVEFVGERRFDALGIGAVSASGVVETSDLAEFVRHHRDDHKWLHAVLVIAGSATMPGAAELTTLGAMATGASMVRVCVPNVKSNRLNNIASEAVRIELETSGLANLEVAVSTRLRAVVLGPGIGRDVQLREQVRSIVERAKVPLVIDADGLHAVDLDWLANRRHVDSPIILTPHDGEYTALCDRDVGVDRLEAARWLAARTNCVALLKGPTTFIAEPGGAARVVTSGTPALATAGTGDVLAGMIAGALARGHHALDAAALSAHLHALAGARLSTYGSAHQLGDAVATVLGDVSRAR